MTYSKRLVSLSHLKGFIFALMAFDHALHAYALYWGKFWFFRDYHRSPVFDVFYLFDQAMIMPMLFFCFGMWVLVGYEKMGFKKYLKAKLLRYGVPYVLGVPLLVPLLSYPKFHEYQDPGPGFWEYVSQVFFWDRFQAGPFWVPLALFVYSFLIIGLCRGVPAVQKGLVAYWQGMQEKPLLPFLSLLGMSILVYGVSDLLWGAPWWVSFSKFFALQGEKFIMNFVYFSLGAGLGISKIWQDDRFWEKLQEYLKPLIVVLGGISVGYLVFVMNHEATTFSDELVIARAQGASWGQWVGLFMRVGGDILIRTSLLGVLVGVQVSVLLLVFTKYFKEPTPLWQSLAACGYGIFIAHETFMVWLQFILNTYELSPFLKMPLAFVGGFFPAWVLVAWLRRFDGVRKVIG